jgi:hypothetical protein
VDQSARPFFGALDALAVNNDRRRARFANGRFAAEDMKRVINPLEGAIMLTAAEVATDCTGRRQVLADRPPLASNAAS